MIVQYKNAHKLPKERRHKLVHSPRNRISHNDIYFMGEFQWPAISPLLHFIRMDGFGMMGAARLKDRDIIYYTFESRNNSHYGWNREIINRIINNSK